MNRGYSIYRYGRMIADDARLRCYVEALERTVGPESIVVDLGTGTGFIAMLACRLGAKKVYAIEVDDSVKFAKRLAEINSYGDSIEFIQADSRSIDLPEKADVLVSDLRGILPLHGEHIPTIADARERFLRSAGTLIPLKDAVYASVVEAHEVYSRYTYPWGDNGLGLDLGLLRSVHVNSWLKVQPEDCRQLADIKLLFELDYTDIDQPDLQAETTFNVLNPGDAHGVSLWFRAELVAGLFFSSAYDDGKTGYGMGFFPWETAVMLQAGDTVKFSIDARLVNSEYMWSWKTVVYREGSELVRFNQSTFFIDSIVAGLST